LSTTFPGESDEYRIARDRLLAREVELRQAMEAVAGERRALPPGGAVPDDYVFRSADGGPSIEVRLSELFAPGRDSLIVYNMMFPRDPGDDRPVRPRAERRSWHSPKVRARRAHRSSISSTVPPTTLHRVPIS
jgi:predicted dithiol-disulfide oxidoreductase (DUF899 family)